MTDIEEALALIAAPCTDEHFFPKALKALALITQCRWAAFGRPSSKQGLGEVVAFCDGKKSLPSFEFKMADSPCEQMYLQCSHRRHLIYNNLQKYFPNFELIQRLGAHSYQAELILDNEGQPFGHIFVLDTHPQEENDKSNKFFRLLAQRIGVEYHRHIVVKELQRNREMISSSKQFMSFVDTNYYYQVVSKGYESLFDKDSDEINGSHVAELHGQAIFESKIQPLLDRCFSGEELIDQIWVHPPSQDKAIFINVHHNPYYDANGVIKGAIISAHNITEIQQAKERIEYLADHDCLTGLANRRSLFSQIDCRLKAIKSDRKKIAIVYLDLDNFKKINDNFGHNTGDLVLKKVAEILKATANNADTIARMGGDEFIIVTDVVCDQTSHVTLRGFGEKIAQALNRTVLIEDCTIKISASIGTHLVTDYSAAASSHINQADSNMFRAKSGSRLAQ
ncbi:diguanylate cyclase domain-containing protein [Shewanella sp. 10N.286.54.B9]|uniref:diguanylate cyclase domain-containing protein n=1 Tax=Shewanella sp. 10N.286.54.B9 TaxID=3229719 RepID=UPI00354DF9CA